MLLSLNKKSKQLRFFRSYEIRAFFIFMLITMGFHFFFRFWASSLDYYPIKKMIESIYQSLSEAVYIQSHRVIGLIFELEENNKSGQIIFKNGGIIGISFGCSGLKQILQFVVLFLFVGGSLKHKIWFIPFGMIMMHLTNLFRIIGLSFFVIYCPEYWDLAHDFLFRPLFYVVIFAMWVWWQERFRS